MYRWRQPPSNSFRGFANEIASQSLSSGRAERGPVGSQ